MIPPLMIRPEAIVGKPRVSGDDPIAILIIVVSTV